MTARPAAWIVGVVLLAGCGATAPVAQDERPTVEPSLTTTPQRTPTPPPTPQGWQVGARPLPLRADGFGVVSPTPKVLRVRELPTVDELPPPAGGRWASSIAPIDDALRARMGGTWHRGCPVALTDLRYLTVAFRGFDDAAHTGELIVHRRAARQVVGVFRTLFHAGFPIESMRIVTEPDLTAPPTGDGNTTAAFVCRQARKQTQWSAHAYGLALDLNPFQNPYHRGDLVLPELARSYLDRSRRRPGMLLPNGVAVRAFEAIGWSWGGRWTRTKDTMHFSALDR